MAANVTAILLAAGVSSRMDGVDKLWADIDGEPLVALSLRTLASVEGIDRIVVVAPPARHVALGALAATLPAAPAVRCVAGGERRQDSVRSGIEASADADWYLVHDAARPLASRALVGRMLQAACAHGAAVPGVPVTDTIKRVDAGGRVSETVDRTALCSIQTPQAFSGEILRAAHRASAGDATDDAAMVEALGTPVAVVPGERTNLKVTTGEDLALVRAWTAAQRIGGGERERR